MIRNILILLFACCYSLLSMAQNITVDSQTYSPQQLIENILINSNCISNVMVTNTTGGDFNNTDQSYGFFDATGTTFPFQSGIVLSTGKLSNVPGPNTSLSDDDATNWIGDTDLEIALQESNTLNATLIEFDFTTIANEISFRYIFASEEYQEGNPNTCNFSDLFGFLIRPIGSNNYTNIAVIPNTQTPVKVTTVHPEIPNGCDAENEDYFDSFNNTTAPINFNGQTTVLTATANTIPNQTYHVKLVIADEQNYRYDSAVFLEAGSFNLTTNLGIDRLLATNNPACGNETIVLNATQPGINTYKWFKNGIEQTNQTNGAINVIDTGIYNVEVTLANTCISYGSITIEYATTPTITNTTLIACDIDQNGLTTYNLNNASNTITFNNTNLGVINFYNSLNDANMQTNAITNPSSFNNTTAMQTVFAEVINQSTGCIAIAEITLDISTITLSLVPFETCDEALVDGFTTFNLNDIRNQISPLVPTGAIISFYETIENAFSETNVLNDNYTNTIQNSQSIYVKVNTATNTCYAISDIILNISFTPQLLPNNFFTYCLNNFPETITLFGGVTNGLASNFNYQWLLNGVNTNITTPIFEANQTGTYTVIVATTNGCTNSRDIIVTASNKPIIENLTFTELTTNNTATLTVSGEGDYEYAINNENGFYQDLNSFSNLAPGFHTIYVRDKNGCGSAFKQFSILGFPKFFTPNGDVFNNVWKPLGTNSRFNNNLEILIFNRYGKLLTQVNPVIGWDGTLKGFALPSDDYWYIINHPNGKQYKGHFALVR